MNKRKRGLLLGKEQIPAAGATNSGQLQLEDVDLPVRHLPGMGEPLFLVPSRPHDTIFSSSDIEDAMVASGAWASASLVLPDQLEEFIAEHELASDIARVVTLAADLFGPAAVVTRAIETAEDSGEFELVLTVQFPAPAEDDLLEKNDVFMRRLAVELTPAGRREIVVLLQPADGHQPG